MATTLVGPHAGLEHGPARDLLWCKRRPVRLLQVRRLRQAEVHRAVEVKLELTEDEAEWLAACLGLVMQISRHWDSRTAQDLGNRLLAKLTLARVQGNVGMDPDEWLKQATERLGNSNGA